MVNSLKACYLNSKHSKSIIFKLSIEENLSDDFVPFLFLISGMIMIAGALIGMAFNFEVGCIIVRIGAVFGITMMWAVFLLLVFVPQCKKRRN